MSRAARRRRGALLLALAVACGGMAASQVQDRERRLEARIGPLVPVVVARADLRAGSSLSPARLAARRVPARFAPPDALAAPAEAVGARLAVPLAAGAYVTSGALAPGEERSPPAAGAGERAVDVAVAAGGDLAGTGPGTRVDVLITTESGDGRGRSYLALEDVELLGARPADQSAAGGETGAAAHATAVATLRVTLREAVLLTAAQSFAREIRLLVRPPGERRTRRAVVVDAAAL
ncbi:MAG: Flp pilus assembly protein CpaB [Thermoleophilaceae bacterium]